MTVQADILKAIEGIEHGFQQAGQALSERIFHCRQVHGAEIVDARSLSESGRHAADGVFSEGPLAVAVVTADCLPILMSSRDGRVVAALHTNSAAETLTRLLNMGVPAFNLAT
ncbi:ATPase, T2SS/T4P/T4SS family, partial [Pseudomonas aeruginosa]|uniref:ATPase, T2SS/T4P/T4SS family n=1 Tax=Pseudomonas aeruginosa TaxID=287 RepID=UPI0020C890E3